MSGTGFLGLVRVPITEASRAEGPLTVTSRVSDTFANNDGPVTVELWKSDPDGKHIWVPRHYAREYGLVNPVRYQDVRAKYSATFKPTKELWDLQKPAVAEMVRHLREHECGILQALCGAGKTVMGLNISAEMGLRTLIVVNREYLMFQWLSRIESFLGIPRSEVGIVRGSTVDTSKAICVGLVQTLYKKKFKPEVMDRFGLVIYDEVHGIGAPRYSEAASKVGAPYRLGLSATPERGDGLTDVITWHIGGVAAVCQAETAPVEVWEYATGAAIDSNNCTDANGAFNVGLIHRFLARNQKRNEKLCHVIERAYRAKRKTLVLSHFLDHLRTLRHMCGIPLDETGYFCGNDPDQPRDVYTLADFVEDPDEFIEGFLIPKLDPVSVTKQKYRGAWKVTAHGLERPAKLSNKIRAKWKVESHRRTNVKIDAETLVKNAEGSVLFATFSMAREAMDVATLDTEILATPVGGVEQAVGRVARVHPDKLKSILIDPVDYDYGKCLGIFKAMRRRTYAKLGYPVHKWVERN